MAKLTDQQCTEIMVDTCARTDEESLTFGALTKHDITAAVKAVDTFFDNNIPAINNAFPEPAKSALTARQKAHVVVLIIRKRYLGF